MKATLSQLAYPFTHFCRDIGVQPGISFNFTALPDWEEEYHFGEKHCPFVQQDRDDVFYDMLAHIFIVGASVAGDHDSEDEYYDIRMESSLAMNSRKTMRMMADAIKATMERMMENPDLVTLLRPLMAYNLSSTHQMRWIEADNDYTTQVLYRYGFQWSTTARDYVHRFVDTIIGFDYFKG